MPASVAIFRCLRPQNELLTKHPDSILLLQGPAVSVPCNIVEKNAVFFHES